MSDQERERELADALAEELRTLRVEDVKPQRDLAFGFEFLRPLPEHGEIVAQPDGIRMSTAAGLSPRERRSPMPPIVRVRRGESFAGRRFRNLRCGHKGSGQPILVGHIRVDSVGAGR